MENGTHFWAIFLDSVGNGLVMMCKYDFGIYVCGAWENSVPESEFKVIEIVPFPKGYEAKDLYYR